MSWDADLYTPVESFVLARGGGAGTLSGKNARIVHGSYNYTHNTSPMIYRTLPVVFPGWDRNGDGPWYRILDGKTGPEGAELLDRIVNCFMEAPEMFRVMNPPNGWGDYDSLLGVLVDMRDAGRAHPTAKWETSG